MNSEPYPGSFPPPGNPSLQGRQDTLAAHPARLKLNIGLWLAANPSTIYVALGVAALGVAVLFFKWLLGIALLIAALWNFFKDIREAKQKFWDGDVCPGVVVSAQEGLVAAYADLVASGDRPYPAIQIFKQPLHRFTAGQPHDGMRVAAAALYLGNVKEPAWKNFHPEVINCVIHDPAAIERVLGSISEDEWQKLESCVASLPDRKQGLHHVDLIGAENGQHGVTRVIPPEPWFKSREAIAPLVAVGIIAAVLVFVAMAAFVAKNKNHPQPQATRPTFAAPVPQPPVPPQPPANPQPPTIPPRPIIRPPATMPQLPAPPAHNPPSHAGPEQLTQTGPFSVGSAVEADWAGGRIPGKITAINLGGFSVMVQLEDARFPQPIVLSTNQIRLK